MNKVILMGRLTADPELKSTSNGLPVTTFAIAVDRDFKSSNGEREADFPSIVAWRNTAEFVSRYFQKGKPIIVEGKLQTRSYEDQNGKKIYVTEVVADAVKFVLSDNSTGQGGAGDYSTRSADPKTVIGTSENMDGYQVIEEDDDLPF